LSACSHSPSHLDGSSEEGPRKCERRHVYAKDILIGGAMSAADIELRWPFTLLCGLAAAHGGMLVVEGAIMSHRFNFPNPPGPAPITPMVYVTDKTVWQYKLLTRNLAKEEAPSEAELNALGKDGWELAGIVTDHPIVRFYFKRLKD
jgi:hypothetical protein